MKKKYGPLPLWAWGAIGIVTIYLYYRHSSSSSSSSGTTSTDAVDPVTGIPYSQEEQAYQNEAASAMSPGSGGSNPVDTTNGGTTPPDLTQELQDITGLITGLQDAGLVNQTPTDNGGTSPSVNQPANSDGTTPPDNASTPTTAPSAHTRMSTGTLVHAGAIQAPAGVKPPAKRGYTVVGTGHGNHQYVPDKLVKTPGGRIYGSVSHTAPVVHGNQVAKGLGNGLWEIVPKPKSKPPKTKTPTRSGGGSHRGGFS